MWGGCWRFLLPYRSGCFYEFALTRFRSSACKIFRLSVCREEQRRVLDAILHFFHSLYSTEGIQQLISWFVPTRVCTIICTIIFVEPVLSFAFFFPAYSLLAPS